MSGDREEIAALKIILAASAAGRMWGLYSGKDFAQPPAPGFVAVAPGEAVAAVISLACDDRHPLRFLDNEIGECVDCGRRVQFRPDVPTPAPKICAWCMVRRLETTP
jgi:hypothetical protein